MSGNLKKLLNGIFLLEKGEKVGETQKIFYHRLTGMGVFKDRAADEKAGWDSQRVYFITDRVSAQRNITKGITTPLGIIPSTSISPTKILKYTIISEYAVPEDIKNDLMAEENKRKSDPPIDPEERTILLFCK